MKSAMITGGCRGIGLAISRQLQQEGYALAIMGTVGEDRLTDVLGALRAAGPVSYTCGSLDRAADRSRFLQDAVAACGRVDLLVNNAGVAPLLRADLLDMPEESYDRVMGINLKGPVFLSQMAARRMLEQPMPADPAGLRGMVINIGSISADTVSLNRSEYCLSKAGLSMFTQLLAARLADSAIPVYEIRPGVIKTDMTALVAAHYQHLIEQGAFPIRRWGTPEDVAAAVSLLASGRLAYSTGECLHVDGGFHIRRL